MQPIARPFETLHPGAPQLNQGFNADSRLIRIRISQSIKTVENKTFYEMELNQLPCFLQTISVQGIITQPKVYTWRLWHRYSEVQNLHSLLEARHKDLPKFQSTMTAWGQGAFNPEARINFLESYLNDLVKPRLLSKLIQDQAFIQFFCLQERRSQIELQLSEIESYFRQSPILVLQEQSAPQKQLQNFPPQNQQQPRDNMQKIEQFLKALLNLSDTKDTPQIFADFECLNVPYSEDQVKRILYGNGLGQLGIFHFAQRPELQREIFKLLSDSLDELKNQNFEVFKRVFAKTLPTMLQKFGMGQLLQNEQSQRHVLSIMIVYLDARQRSPAQQKADLEVIFTDEIDREIFIDLYEQSKLKKVSRGLEVGRVSGAIRGGSSNFLTSNKYSNLSRQSRSPQISNRSGSSSKLRGKFFQNSNSQHTSQHTSSDSGHCSGDSSSDDSDVMSILKQKGMIKPIKHIKGKKSHTSVGSSAGRVSEQSSDTDGPTETICTNQDSFKEQITYLVNDHLHSPKKVHKKCIEMFLSPQMFQPDTLYQISFQQSTKIDKNFQVNLEETLTGAPSPELKKAGLDLRLVEEISPTLKIIEITFTNTTQWAAKDQRVETKRYLLSYSHQEATATEETHISLLQIDQDNGVSQKILLVLVLPQQTPLSHQNQAQGSPKQLNTVQERPYEEDKESLSHSGRDCCLKFNYQTAQDGNPEQDAYDLCQRQDFDIVPHKPIKSSISKVSASSLKTSDCSLQSQDASLHPCLIIKVKKSKTKLKRLIMLLCKLCSNI